MRKNLALLSVIIIANILVYRQITGFKPVDLDEPHLLSEKWTGLKVTNSVRGVFRQDVFGEFYRPVLTLSFMLDARRSGEVFEPGVFHSTNLLIHVLNAVLCFALLAGLGYCAELAAGGALIFSLHPAIAGASAWIPGRNDSLLFLAAGLALLCLTLAVKRRSAPLFAAHLCFFLAALLTKETAAVLAVIFPAWALLAGRGGAETVRARHAVLASVGWALCLAVYWFMRAAVIKAGAAPSFPGFAELLLRTGAYASYLFFPGSPPVYAWFKDLSLARIVWVNAAAITLFTALWRLSGRHALAVAIASAYLLILPSAFSDSFIPHRTYLPAFFFAWALTEAGSLLRYKGRIIILLLLAAAAIYLGAATYGYLGNFKDPSAFWSNAYRASPSSEAAYQMGYRAQLRGDLAAAEKYYLTAMAKNPLVPDAANNLGVIYKQTGRWAQAMRFYEKELAITPGRQLVLENMGNLLMAQGEYGRAAAVYRQKISADPGGAAAYANLIFCLRRLGMNAEADEYAGRLAALQSRSAQQ